MYDKMICQLIDANGDYCHATLEEKVDMERYFADGMYEEGEISDEEYEELLTDIESNKR